MQLKTYDFCAPCLIGVESIAAGEFRRLGFENVRCEDGRVYFTGGEETLARANIYSRYCERILICLASFPADSFDKLFDALKKQGYAGYLSFEDFSAPHEEDEKLARNLAYIKAIWEESGFRPL